MLLGTSVLEYLTVKLNLLGANEFVCLSFAQSAQLANEERGTRRAVEQEQLIRAYPNARNECWKRYSQSENERKEDSSDSVAHGQMGLVSRATRRPLWGLVTPNV